MRVSPFRASCSDQMMSLWRGQTSRLQRHPIIFIRDEPLISRLLTFASVGNRLFFGCFYHFRTLTQNPVVASYNCMRLAKSNFFFSSGTVLKQFLTVSIQSVISLKSPSPIAVNEGSKNPLSNILCNAKLCQTLPGAIGKVHHEVYTLVCTGVGTLVCTRCCALCCFAP